MPGNFVRTGLDAGLTKAMPDGAKISSENYRTFRRRFQIFQTMCRRRGADTVAEGALALLASFEGDLFDKLEAITLEKLEQPTAFDEILKILDMHFQYAIEVKQPEKIEKFIQNFRRLKGEHLNQYLLRHQQEVRTLREHEVDLPQSFLAWHVLHRSCIPEWQVPSVRSLAPTKPTVEEVGQALIRMFGPDHKPHPKDIHRTAQKITSAKTMKTDTYVMDEWDGDSYHNIRVPDDAYFEEDQREWEDEPHGGARI